MHINPKAHSKPLADALKLMIVKALSDPKFCKELEADTSKQLKEYGVELPHGVSIQLISVENQSGSQKKAGRFMIQVEAIQGEGLAGGAGFCGTCWG